MRRKYSLWFIPSGNVYNKLTNLISRLSEKYSSPNFEPHVTLSAVAGTENEMVTKTSRLANLIKPFEIKLTKVSYLDEYFRCLFIKVKKTKDIMDANKKA